MIIEILFILLLCAWRVSDGGWPRKLPMSNVVCIMLCIIAIGAPSQDLRLLWMAGPVAWCLLKGYEPKGTYAADGSYNHDGTYDLPVLMIRRAWPCLLLPVGAGLAWATGWHDLNVGALGAPAIIILGSAVGPWIRRNAVGLPGTSNRYAEAVEGAAAGLALALL